MYILTQEPVGGRRAAAFEALDNAFGTEEFSQGQAMTVIENALGESGVGAFKDLESSGCITEVEQ